MEYGEDVDSSLLVKLLEFGLLAELLSCLCNNCIPHMYGSTCKVVGFAQ
jgi:hypothetical protein